MKTTIVAAIFTGALFALQAVAPKTDVVIETKDGIVLHVEYVAETDKLATVDVRAAIMPAKFCDEKDFPAYLPKGKFKKPSKMANGECRFVGNPFITRSMALEAGQIAKRHDTTLLTLSKAGEKKQLPFYETSRGKAWGFNFQMEQQIEQAPSTGLGLQAFPMDPTMDTIQLVDVNGSRSTIHPGQGLWAKWLQLDPRVGVMYTPLLPTGEISLLNFGVVGFTMENSFAIPELKFLPLKKHNLRLRGGLNAGFHSFSQDLYQNNQAVATGKITLIPVLFQLTLFWDLKPKSMKMTISPYFRLADGIVFSSVSTEVKPAFVSLAAPGAETSRAGSYIGNGLQVALGVELRPAKWPVAFVLDGGYFLHSQDVSGSYFIFNVGAAWHYGGTPQEAKFLPIQYLGSKSVVLNLKGTVKEPDGDALPGSQIIAFVKGTTTVQKETTADDKGKYSLELDPGLDYVVEARRDGYVKSKVELLLTSNDKKTREQDFILAAMVYSLEGVNFKPDSDQLVTGKAPEKALLELVKFLQANPEVKIEIGGHTAASGADDDNARNLSKKRAESVRKFIAKKGIDEGRMTSEGYGGSKPIADGKTAAGAAKNRRVEVRILTE